MNKVEKNLKDTGFKFEVDDLGFVTITKGDFLAAYSFTRKTLNAPFMGTSPDGTISNYGYKKYKYDYESALCAIVTLQADFEIWQKQVSK